MANGINGYTSVSSWRDDVSRSLGALESTTKNIDKKLDHVCKTQKAQEDRIEVLETLESNRKAVAKRMVALQSVLIAVITAIANIAFKIFK